MAVAPFNHITATYTAGHAWMYETIVAPSVYRSRQIIDSTFLSHLPQGARILDVGAGGGLFTNYLADQRPDLTIVGVDLAEPQLKRARKRMRAYADRVTFQRGDATALDFPDRSFDGVISYGSVKHWTSQEKGMAECVRVLKPGGPLLVTDADRSATFDDAKDFISHYKMPRFLDGPNLALFRTWIAGRSIDLDDARALAASVHLDEVDVRRIPDSPLVMIAGRRPAE
ncbi:class I SAM-dependent methyltransferase [Mycobacterium sp. PS03-16]|uniref:class I SAM-dependent methyltransferase n=1 Tax=Mycobacterium sp. PS03-16 TaxID=2559611 RepID=UPI0010730F3C|nr:class I SAM-dependent methyltransferase [Mycobacterium sp. PS03-16]TFV60021.1 class I SAM-dependent methyltransferase [Mycobacterium sp. PS03-16]